MPEDAVTSDLAARITRLEDLAALHRLKADYAAAADSKYRAGRERAPEAEFQAGARRQVECFTEDAAWEGGEFGGTISGRENLFQFFCQSPWNFTQHLYSAAALTVTGDTAEGRWRLWEVGVRQDGRTVLLTGITQERYRRTAEGWRVSAMSFVELHAVVLTEEPEALRCLIPKGESL
jgi:hypothetical protein